MKKNDFNLATALRDLSKVVARTDGRYKVLSVVQDSSLRAHTSRNILVTYKNKGNDEIITKNVGQDGRVNGRYNNSDFDLFLVNRERHGYINLYKQADGTTGNRKLTVYKSADKARSAAAGKRNAVVVAKRVEWQDAA